MASALIKISKSELKRRVFNSDGFDIRVRRRCVLNQFMREHMLTLESIANDFVAAKEKVARFPITFDESKSVQNQRYMNLSLRNAPNFQSLSLK